MDMMLLQHNLNLLFHKCLIFKTNLAMVDLALNNVSCLFKGIREVFSSTWGGMGDL